MKWRPKLQERHRLLQKHEHKCSPDYLEFMDPTEGDIKIIYVKVK